MVFAPNPRADVVALLAGDLWLPKLLVASNLRPSRCSFLSFCASRKVEMRMTEWDWPPPRRKSVPQLSGRIRGGHIVIEPEPHPALKTDLGKGLLWAGLIVSIALCVGCLTALGAVYLIVANF